MALPQWLSVVASAANAAGTSPEASISCRKRSTMASASSWLRVTVASFQLLGLRLPACLTSRWEARTCWVAAAAAAAEAPPPPLMVMVKAVGARPKVSEVPAGSGVGLLAAMRRPSTLTPSRCRGGGGGAKECAVSMRSEYEQQHPDTGPAACPEQKWR